MLIRKFKAIAKYTKFLMLKTIWLVCDKNETRNSYMGTAHILLVKDLAYLSFAKISALSFLYYHKKSRVIIHCDQITYLKTKNYFRPFLIKRRIEVLEDQNISDNWQKMKMVLILSLNGTNDIYMDADLRWRANISKMENVTFLVREFDFYSHPEYQNLLPALGFPINSQYFMLNTSFFTFAGIEVNQVQIIAILQVFDIFETTINNIFLDLQIRERLSRLSEQICLSCFAVNLKIKIKFLKSTDGRLDKGIVESAYYGATGLGF